MYFDDLPVGFTFETGTRQIPLDEMVDFARKYDPQPFHVDEDAGRDTPYGGLIASGFQTMVVGFLLTLEADIWNEASLGSPGIDELRWLKPVRPGDTLRVNAEVIGSAPSRSRPDRGRTEIRYDTYNQDGDKVMTYRTTHILRRRPVTGKPA
ncbi:MaoC family dehydratase [Thalassovita aquimarina]|uniref:MaoC family dehydratase n=1 Tax=Thalassovita aquimarina TaxID=2785917 RepID=A0ABS5HUI4_9RHOB|nr:MaoC family dehydratase [Thalassovita aquimarina]MBR9652632.1 MaoC family dehydratase [Thalassovita aquimarina]